MSILMPDLIVEVYNADYRLRTYQPTTPIASWGKRQPTGLWFRVAQVRVLTRQHSVLERITPRSDTG